MKIHHFIVFALFLVLLGCQSVTRSSVKDFSDSPEEFTKDLLRQSDEIVSIKRSDYSSLLKSKVDPELLARISSLGNNVLIAKKESQGSGVSTFEIDTIPKDLILLRRQVPNQQKIVRVDSYEGRYSVVVHEKVSGDGRSEGYEGEVLILFDKTSQLYQLKDVIFRRTKGVPEWRLSGYLSDQEKMIEDLRRRL